MDIFVTEEARPGSCAVLGKSGLDLETRGDGHPLTETTAIPSLREASTATRRRMARYWFPAKRYGWGWGPPATWQGWAVLAAFVGASGWHVRAAAEQGPTDFSGVCRASYGGARRRVLAVR